MKTSDISLTELGLVDASPDPEFDRITKLVAKLANTPVALISIIESEKERQFFKSAFGLAEPWKSKRETPLSHSFCQFVKASDELLLVNDSREHELVKDNLAIRDLNAIAYIGAPIRDIDDAPIGTLCAIDDKPREWSESEADNLKNLADFVTDKIKLRTTLHEQQKLCVQLSEELNTRKKNEEMLTKLATTDPMTGLLNRRAFFERAIWELARVKRYGGDVSLLLIDIDKFKTINDTLGHLNGDEVIIAVAKRLSETIRVDIDVLSRHGGEEFAVLLPNTPSAGAIASAERCREAIADKPFELDENTQLTVTISVGVSSAISAKPTVQDLLSRADWNLYAAKHNGRNQVFHSLCDNQAKAKLS